MSLQDFLKHQTDCSIATKANHAEAAVYNATVNVTGH